MEGQQFFGVGRVLLADVFQCGLPVGGGKHHLAAAAFDGGQQAVAVVGNQQEGDIGGRFFQYFQQAVGCLGVHAFGRMDEDDAFAAAYGGQLDVFDQAAYGIDFDLQQFAADGFAFGYFGGEFVEVGVAVLGEQVAGWALPAGLAVCRCLFAQQCGGQVAGEGGFAGIFPAGKEQGVGQLPPVSGKLLPVGLMPGIDHVREGAVRTGALYSCARFCNSGRLKA